MENHRELPPLFKTDRTWKCWVIGDVVYKEYGQITGTKTKTPGRTYKGKNIGKVNETSAEEQAWNVANKEWVDKVNEGYAPSKDDKKGLKMLATLNSEKQKTGGHGINTVSVMTNNNSSLKKTTAKANVKSTIPDIIPMKAEKWECETSDPSSVKAKVKKYFKSSFYIQPKMDGWRCIVRLVNGEIVLTSNSGKQYPWFNSLRKVLKEWLKEGSFLDGLDGELYCGQFYDQKGVQIDPLLNFSIVCSICGLLRSEPHKYEDQIQFHCFDLVDLSGTFTQTQRFEKLDALFSVKYDQSRVVKVDTQKLESLEGNKIACILREHEKMGFEGSILRTENLRYAPNKRSLEIRKLKNFVDEEFKIIGCELDSGVGKEHFVWVLETEKGAKFSAKPMGTKESKLEWYTNREKYIGKMMTVKFQDLSEEGIPRFPIAKYFRDNKGTD